jgi:D-alanyl-D-alanine carboxypeptidase
MIRARAAGTAVLLIALAACSGPDDTRNGGPAAPPAGEVPTETTSPGDQLHPFPTDVFADLREEPLDAATAALLQRTLDAAAGDSGMAATLMTADGTWTGATGSADGVRAMRPEAQMAIGSITKTIVAAQVMQLVEAGRLVLDDPAADHLPKQVRFDTNGATVGDLLAMRSGIPDYVGALYRSLSTDTRHAWTVDEMLALVPSRRAPAGSEFDYSSTNYVLLGLILEHATGRPLAQILRGGVLAGPGLARLVYQPAERPTAPMAAPGGAPALSRGRGGRYLPSLAGATAAGPAGGMASDSATLARWWGRLCGGQIVSATSFETMIDFERTPEYALAIQDRSYDSPAAVGNEGVHVGFVSLAECLPDAGAVVVVLANDEDADSASVANALMAELATTRGG